MLGTLAQPDWVNAGNPLVLIGNSGTGKYHLLIGIGTAIAEAGLKVRYIPTLRIRIRDRFVGFQPEDCGRIVAAVPSPPHRGRPRCRGV
jgi:hypothetical protein